MHFQYYALPSWAKLRLVRREEEDTGEDDEGKENIAGFLKPDHRLIFRYLFNATNSDVVSPKNN